MNQSVEKNNFFVRQIFSQFGHDCATIGTLGFYCRKDFYEIGHTTPDPPVLFGLLDMAAKAGVKHVAMEVSSHALVQGKLGPILFDRAAFTSFSQDHLDFHKSMDEYLDAKLEYWKHSSQLLKLNEDVSLSMMFRVVRATVDVYEDGRLVNPTVWGTGKKEKQLNDGWEWLQKNKTEYDQKCSDIHLEILDRFSKYF